MESSPNRISLLLEANLRFLSANLQINSIVLNTLNNPDALDENQNVLNNLLNWLKSLNQVDLTQGEQTLVDTLKDSVRKAKSFELLLDQKNILPLEQQKIESTASNQTVEKQKNTTQTDVKILSNPEIVTEESVTEKDQTEQEQLFIFRNKNEEDRWEYLTSITSFITSYEHLMHLLIPNLALEVVKELHRFDGKNKILINEAISYPSILLQNLITKFLREAPGSNLFRRIRRIKLDYDIDLSFEQAVNIGERQNIKSFVANYFKTLTDYLDPNNTEVPEINNLEERTRYNFKQFSLGPASVEMRLTAIIKHVTESALNDAEAALTNENASLKTKVIYLATTQLICDFQSLLLNEPRILQFLEELKS